MDYRWTWLALFGLAGCTALPSPPAAVHTYLFSAPFPAPRRGPGPVLLITAPRAAAGYDRPGIAYRRSPTRLDYYAASEWADEPARLIEPLIIAAAEASGGFEAVVSAGTGLTAETRLDTEIVRIEHELQSAPSQGRLTLRAQLVDVGPRAGHRNTALRCLRSEPERRRRGRRRGHRYRPGAGPGASGRLLFE